MKKIIMALALPFLLESGMSLASTELKHHTVGVFLGTTHIDGENEFTYGVEYEYRIDDFWGIGATYESIEDAHHGEGVYVKTIDLYMHPGQNWRLGVGYGEEDVRDHHTDDENLVRLGVAYDFHLGGFAIAPTFEIDFLDGHSDEVVGLIFSKSF